MILCCQLKHLCLNLCQYKQTSKKLHWHLCRVHAWSSGECHFKHSMHVSDSYQSNLRTYAHGHANFTDMIQRILRMSVVTDYLSHCWWMCGCALVMQHWLHLWHFWYFLENSRQEDVNSVISICVYPIAPNGCVRVNFDNWDFN